MRKDLRVLLGGVAAGAFYVAMAQAAQAQAPSPVREGADERPVASTVEEVVVTARRVEESLQEVPIPVSAFSGEELEEARAFTPESLTNQVPNLKIFKGAGNSNTYAYYIRGVGRDIGYFYAEAPVSLYVDDVFYPYQAGPVLGIGGIDHAEVLRGPQGTLYGKNATVGTVKIFHKRPNPNAEDRAFGLTVGSYGRFEAQASQNIPIIDGKLAFRADMGMKYFDGFIKDIARNDTVGGINTKGGRFGLTWTPNDRDEVYLAIDASSARDEVHPWTPIVYGPGNLTVAPRFNDRYVTESYMPDINMLDTGGVTLQGRTEMAGVQLRSISSYRGFHQQFANDNGASVTNPLNWNDIETHDNSWSQEFVASGAALGDRLTYVGGLFYFNSTASMRFMRGSGAEEHTKQRSKSAAAYVDGSFEVLEGLNVSAGVRYTRDAKEAHQTSWNAAGTQLLSVPASDSWNATTWKVGADYQLNDNIMVFASWGTGYKGGGLSTGQPTVPSQVFFIPPEFATNKEIGIKSDWFDRRLRVNLNYFDTDYEDMIQTILNTTTLVSTVAYADAKIKGFEWDITAKPTARWTITVKGATLDAKNVNVEPGFPAFVWEDKTLKHAPDLTYNIGTSYDLDLYGGVLTLAADYEWMDDMYQSLARDISTMGWAFDLLNLRVAYEFANPSYSLVLDATNVLDEEYFKLGSTRLARQYGPPTEISLSFRYRM